MGLVQKMALSRTVCVCLFRSYVFVFHTQTHMETQQELATGVDAVSEFFAIF